MGDGHCISTVLDLVGVYAPRSALVSIGVLQIDMLIVFHRLSMFRADCCCSKT